MGQFWPGVTAAGDLALVQMPTRQRLEVQILVAVAVAVDLRQVLEIVLVKMVVLV
jgi:hypothetical protein